MIAAATAQTHWPQYTTAQLQQFEAAVKADPNDRNARYALLESYFLNPMLSLAVAIPARRRHILWLIEHTPSDPMAGGPSATIDASGHRLADPMGFRLASDAWKLQIARQDLDAYALANAAYFFKLSDKPLTVSLLERAIALEPANKELGARLGDEYALAILGITMVNKNTLPMAADPALAQSPLAMQARQALNVSRNPYVLAKAGYMIWFQGSVLRGMGKLAFDPMPIAKGAADRAVSLAPGDREVAGFAKQVR